MELCVYRYNSATDSDAKGRTFLSLITGPIVQRLRTIRFRSLQRTLSDALPTSLHSIPNLHSIDVSNCNLKEFPEAVLNARNLIILNISGNNIPNLPIIWNALSSTLQNLDIKDNPLGVLNPSIKLLGNLQILDLSDCGFTKFPKALTKMTSLRVLKIAGNSIGFLPLKVEHLRHLETLDISRCNLPGVPTVLGRLPQLTCLNMSSNRLGDLPSTFHEVTCGIQVLSLSRCGFTQFPNTLIKMRKLAKLDISNNSIEYIPRNLEHKTLYSLDISHNKISRISHAISSIEHVDLTGNLIEEICEEVLCHIQNNLSNIVFDTDNLVRPPANVFHLGPQAVDNYFKDQKLHAAHKYTFQNVVLMGTSGSGKSSLGRSLQSGEPRLAHPDDRTVMCEDMQLDVPEASVHLQITDLGGLSDYEFTYPLLIRDHSSCAVVCVDMSTFKKKYSYQYLEKWLDVCVQNLDETGFITVVGTKADLCRHVEKTIKSMEHCLLKWKTRGILNNSLMEPDCQGENDESAMDKLYKKKAVLNNIEISVIATSSKDVKTIKELKKELVFKAGQNRCQLPKNWPKVYELFSPANQSLRLGRISIPLKEALNIIRNTERGKVKKSRIVPYNIPTSDICHNWPEQCLEHLHKRGMIVWHRKCDLLNDTVVLNRMYIIDALKLLFHHGLKDFLLNTTSLMPTFKERVSQNNSIQQMYSSGIVSEALLKGIFHKYDPNFQVLPILKDVMKMAGLCYESEKTYQCGEDIELAQMFYMPWILTKPMDISEHLNFQKDWPSRLPTGHIELALQYEFTDKIPECLARNLILEFQSYLFPGHLRKDWSNMTYIVQNGVQLLMSTTNQCTRDLATLSVRFRSNRNNIPQIYSFCKEIVKGIQGLLEDYSVILHDQYMLCPHCILSGQTAPQHLPIEYLTMNLNREYLRLAMKSVYCCNAKKPLGEIPAALYFPFLIGNGSFSFYIIQSYYMVCGLRHR